MPTLLEMIREAVANAGRPLRNAEIKSYISQKWPGKNEGSIDDQIQIGSVNSRSRVNYPENKIEVSTPREKYDILYKLARGRVELYNPKIHGLWGIRKMGEDFQIYSDEYHEKDGVIYHTDPNWLQFLKEADLAEVNFWSSRRTLLNDLYDGMPFFFKTKDQKIAGFATYAETVRLTADEAWDRFRQGNGTKSRDEFLALLESDTGAVFDDAKDKITCFVLRNPVFFLNPPYLKNCGINKFETMRYLNSNETSAIARQVREFDTDGMKLPDEASGTTNSRAIVNSRPYQNNLKRNLMRLYNGKCAICRMEIPELLRASHIIPHSKCRGKYENSARRLDNSILLCTLHDSLFDSGLITIKAESGKFRVIKSEVLMSYNADGLIQSILEIPDYVGNIPDKHMPSEESLRYHNAKIFREDRKAGAEAAS